MGKDYELELASPRPPTINIVDLTTPIPTTNTIDVTTGDPLISSHDQEKEEPHPWTKDEEDPFEFESAAFDTVLRIDQPKEDKAFIAVYGTGPSFITEFCKSPPPPLPFLSVVAFYTLLTGYSFPRPHGRFGAR